MFSPRHNGIYDLFPRYYDFPRCVYWDLLDRFLARLEQGRLAPVQFCEMLEAFRQVLAALPAPQVAADQIKSTVLRRLFVGQTVNTIPAVLASELSKIHPTVVQRSMQNSKRSTTATAGKDSTEAKKKSLLTDIEQVFATAQEFPKLATLHQEVSAVRNMLVEHLQEIRDFLGLPDLEYKSLNTGFVLPDIHRCNVIHE